MLTKEEIREITPINQEAVEFFLKLAEERMRDALDNKKDLEQKAYILFAGYVAAITALILMIQQIDSPLIGLSIAFLMIGQLCLLLCIKTTLYGVLGREPRIWLEEEVYIKKQDGNDMGLLKAYVLHDYQDHIKISVESNRVKANWIDISVGSGCVAIIPLALLVII